MDFKFELGQEVLINGTRRHGIITERKESIDAPGIGVYLVIEPTLKTASHYEDEITAYSGDDAPAAVESP